MTYKINGTEFIEQPTQGGWVPRKELGIDGAGKPIYPGVREYSLSWNILSPTGMNQLQSFYQLQSVTGTVVADLPRYGYHEYTFFSYSGCTITEPSFTRYFAEYYLDVSITIRNIRT